MSATATKALWGMGATTVKKREWGVALAGGGGGGGGRVWCWWRRRVEVLLKTVCDSEFESSCVEFDIG